jgi:hypothetical protein
VRAGECDAPRLTSCAGDGTVARPGFFDLVELTRLA